jgi:hypothetical protein
MEMKKLLVVGVIFLFIGVSVAPSINSSVVKTNENRNLIEVTSQACGIQGFGTTIVKLTKQQYQDLEQYFVVFRARLNQTMSMQEAASIFKEAVVELNRFGLLPHGMSARQAQRLINPYETSNALVQKASSIVSSNKYTNLCCLIAGKLRYCAAANLLMNGARSFIYNLWINGHPELFGVLYVLSVCLAALLSIRKFLCPLDIFSLLTFGGKDIFGNDFPAVGWIYTAGLQGVKNQTGSMFGQIQLPVKDMIGTLDTGAFGFTGFKIIWPENANLFVGTALWVNIGDSPPENATK